MITNEGIIISCRRHSSDTVRATYNSSVIRRRQILCNRQLTTPCGFQHCCELRITWVVKCQAVTSLQLSGGRSHSFTPSSALTSRRSAELQKASRIGKVSTNWMTRWLGCGVEPG